MVYFLFQLNRSQYTSIFWFPFNCVICEDVPFNCVTCEGVPFNSVTSEGVPFNCVTSEGLARAGVPVSNKHLLAAVRREVTALQHSVREFLK